LRIRHSRRLGLAYGLALCLAPTLAHASGGESQRTFDIPAGEFKRAATAFALQAKVSIDLSAVSACGASRGFRGAAPTAAVIQDLARDAGCAVRKVADRAYQIIPRSPSAPFSRSVEASSEGEATPLSLSELVVVATRRPALVSRLAYAVSLIDHQTVTSHGLRDTSDLALVTPSMTVTNLGPGRDKLIVRGLSDGPLTGQTQSTVGIYLDDVRLTYNAPDPDLLLVDIAQVELVRGPQGALYGAGSLAGVLQISSRRPDPHRREGLVLISGTSTKGGAPGGQSVAMFNAPLMGGRAAVRVVAYAEGQGGYIDDPGQGLRNVNSTRRSGVRLGASTFVGEHWTIDAGLVAQAISSDDTQYAQQNIGPFARRNLIAEPHDNDFLATRLGARGEWGGHEAKITLAVVRHDLQSRYDASGAPLGQTAGVAPLAFDDDNHVGAIVAEASLASRLDAHLQWQAGAFVARTRQGRDSAIRTVGVTGDLSAREVRRDVLGEAAVFGEAIAGFGRGWSLTLGGRLFATRAEASSRSVDGLARTDFRARQSYVGFAPKGVLSYEPAEGLLVYAQASEGYRSGGFNTSVLPDQNFDPQGKQPSRRYDGDELWNFELGAKASLLDGRVHLRAAAFQSLWKNIQSDQLLPSGLPYTANLGDGRNLGIELEGAYLANGLRLEASLLLNNPELESVDPGFPARQDFGLAGVAKVNAALTASYDRALGGDWYGGLDIRTAYIGHSRLTFDARTAPAMGDYSVVRAGVRLSSDRLSLRLAVDNLFDSRGDTFAYGNPFSLKRSPQSTPLRPRAVSLELRATY